MRKVIFHYHLFKNAGTSLDALLKERFGDDWVTREFPNGPAQNRKQVSDWVAEKTTADCFSSHTAQLPPPSVPGVTVLPVIFVRHPLDRIASAYSFERQQGDAGFGSTLARNTSLAGYVETRLSIPNDFQCRDFHTRRLAMMFPEDEGTPVERALRALKELPFVGSVENFAASLARLEDWLSAEGFDGLDLQPVERNVSKGRAAALEERLERLAGEIGADLMARLSEENAGDLQVFESVAAEYAEDETAATDEDEAAQVPDAVREGAETE